ncbi:MAG: transcription-repair coupling factor [Rhizobiales bacterium]|nr:transcription-repair coupling factor [Hyphomicrobiales bacterium]
MPEDILKSGDDLILSGVPDGMEALVLADLARTRTGARDKAPNRRVPKGPALVMIARDGSRLSMLEEALQFFAPDIQIATLPAWDCLPYDRVSPSAAVSAHRMAALSQLATIGETGRPVIFLLTANAAVQRIPAVQALEAKALSGRPGQRLNMEAITGWLQDNGFDRTPTVRERGEYAVRGGIIDLYAPGEGDPLRLDFFGDTLESIRSFDPETQRSLHQMNDFSLVPMSEIQLNEETIRRFRETYVRTFGATTRDDALYQAVSEGRRYAGMEHWLPFFHESLSDVLSLTGDAPIILDHLADEAMKARYAQVKDHYQARLSAMEEAHGDGTPYKPVKPDMLYAEPRELFASMAHRQKIELSPFSVMQVDRRVIDLEGKTGRSFAPERNNDQMNVFDAVSEHVKAQLGPERRVAIACWSTGTAERMGQMLNDHGLALVRTCGNWDEVLALPSGVAALVVLPVETGFETPGLMMIGEQDILGDRLVRKSKRRRKDADFISEVTSLSEGDLVVHIDHGIGRFEGLRSIMAAGAPHDCLEITYHGGDRLFLPVENIELLSRYGSGESETPLDRLGGTAWQARKAKLKKRLLDMADQLIAVAARRALKTATPLPTPDGLYGEFVARFPYDETEDQLSAIDAVLDDLVTGRPMDRLICGDVGFGKTEVALRAAFVAVMNGKQVAVVVPTTLLARQHFQTFRDRFSGLPVRVEQASRLVSGKVLNDTKSGMMNGNVDIVIGTHALLGKAIAFKDLGLLIIDEEQRFGVKHKERLKELKSEVHVLTLSATPIPRTLQLALTGVRELSLITTPPVDRLSVRTFVSPFDGITIREALLRERYRGGQSFYVCPRISDIRTIREFLDEKVPELKVAVAHGQMAPSELEDVMNAFYEGQYDVLLSTTIVESGLDVPRANTLIVHRADMFGLAQLYQIRGRVGRSKTRAYAIMTVAVNKTLTRAAERRLKVLQSLDSLGAGFQLASHDLDQRGSGNLLGEEQSGHVREVGFELYQQMLEEAVATQKAGGESEDDGKWSPQITVGTPVLIPETYVPDLNLRLQLYRRLADLADAKEIDGFGADLIDRFGPLPEEVEHLLKIVFIKGLCRVANVEKVDAGPKGLVLTFRNKEFPNPTALVRYISEQGSLAKIKPDQRLVILRDWPVPEKRLKGSAVILSQLAKLVSEGEKAA